MSKRSAADTHRAIADFIDAHPDIPPPYASVFDHQPERGDLKWYLHINDKGDEAFQRDAAKSIVSSVGGKWSKEFSDDEARFVQVRDGMHMLIVVRREAVCERRVVGTEKVTLPATPAQPALPERTVEREVVEWDCQPVLAEAAS